MWCADALAVGSAPVSFDSVLNRPSITCIFRLDANAAARMVVKMVKLGANLVSTGTLAFNVVEVLTCWAALNRA
jgi:hypothetical protein